MTTHTRLITLGALWLLLPLAAACGDSASPATDANPGTIDANPGTADAPTSDAAPTTPSVRSSSPIDGATAVPTNDSISVVFSEAMDPATLTTSTFTVRAGTAVLPGTVIYADATAVFWPAAHLASDGVFTATITPGAHSAAGVALAAPYTWSFTAGSVVAPGVPVKLGTAGSFVMLAKSGISTVPPSAITGDLGVSPIAASALTGFSLDLSATRDFASSAQVTGKLYASDYAVPTPAKLTRAINDMAIAFSDAAGRAPDVTELGAGDIGGMTLTPGVYKWSSGLLIPTSVTLTGDATAVWIFQIAQDLSVSSATRIMLTGGALPAHVFWQVAGRVELGTTAHLEGVVLSKTAITLRTGASAVGRLLAQTAISVDASTVLQPAP
jgi:Ice-binding-like/Bacterial Ig-like domain